MERDYKLLLVISVLVFSILFSLNLVSAWEFNGTVYNSTGTALYNATINVTLRHSNFSVAGYNSTYSNESGWFNLTVHENSSYFYQPVIQHYSNNATDGSGYIDYVGQSLPPFPYNVFSNGLSVDFYLKEAGTINITAINSLGQATSFKYVIKDTLLGYPIAEGFDSYVAEKIIYVPRDRNYSIMIYPNNSLPISFNWNNFTATSSYNLTTANLSYYNANDYTIQKQFNCSQNLIIVSGNITANGIGGWDEFTIVPYILEPGDMVYLGDNAAMPYNMSAWNNTCDFTVINETNAYINVTGYQLTSGKSNYNLTAIWADGGGKYNISVPVTNATVSGSGLVTNSTATTYSNVSLSYTYYGACSDVYDLTTGWYNITLPGPQESADYILFATARNGTNYYGGYANLTLNYTSSTTGMNFTMYSLMSTDWASSNSNITMNNAANWQPKNISSAKQKFNLVNSSNLTLTQLSAHIEITVDYSNYGAKQFTFMFDTSQDKNASFYLPLINATGIKEINVYSKDYAPKRVNTKTAAQILTNPNITLKTFNPGEIPGETAIAAGSITINIYRSNSTCDVPNPPAGCSLTSSSDMSTFNPLNSIIGGGKISFRMGVGGVLVHYANVDMLASGPPDAMFEENAGATSNLANAFDAALRFGSDGPSIYDYVLISIPYSETAGSGLDDSQTVNMSMPTFYDENWNVIWGSTNGTNVSALAGNQSHYSTYQSQWQTLMTGVNCSTTSNPNSTDPCYIDATNNRIWIRLPHFSGTGPSVTGTITSSSTVSSSSSGSGSFSDWVTYEMSEDEFTNEKGYTKELSSKKRVRFVMNNEYHYVAIIELTPTTALINVSSTPQQTRFNVGDEKKFDVTEDGYYDIKVKLEAINEGKARINLKSIYEEVPKEETEGILEGTIEQIKQGSNAWIWILVVVVLVVIVVIYFLKKKK